MSRASARSQCSVCKNYQATGICRGCEEYFCDNDFTDHRRLLHQKYDALIQERKRIASMLADDRNFDLSQALRVIDEWEQKTIMSLKNFANEIRHKTKDHVQNIRHQLSTHLHDIASQQEAKEKGHIETHLQYWKDLLGQVKQNVVNTTSGINIHTSDTYDWNNQIRLCKSTIEIPRIRRLSIENDSPIRCTTFEPILSTHITNLSSVSDRHVSTNNVTRSDFDKRPTPPVSHNKQYHYLNRAPTDPYRIKPIDGTPERAMAASRSFLVVFTNNDISTFDRNLSERKYNKWNDGTIIDMCYCSPEIGFILLTESKVFNFSARNHTHVQLTSIQPFQPNSFSTCTSNGYSLLISYKIQGTPIDEINTAAWKLITRWKSPTTCRSNEYINRLRYSSNSSEIGMTIYLNSEIHFELRDSKMNLLRRISVCKTGCCGITAIPNSTWLLSDGHYLYVIDQNGALTVVEHHSEKGTFYDVGNVVFFRDENIVMRSQKALYFY